MNALFFKKSAARLGALTLCCSLLFGCAPKETAAPSPSPAQDVLAVPTASPPPTASPLPGETPRPADDTLPGALPEAGGVLSAPGEQRYRTGTSETAFLCPHGTKSGLCALCLSEGALPLPDVVRLSETLALLTAAPRPVGSAQEQAAAELIARELTAMGYAVTEQPVNEQTVGFGRPGVNTLGFALGTAALEAVSGSAEGQVSGTVLAYDPDEPLPASVDGKILLLEKSTTFLSLIQGLRLGVPAGVVLVDVPQAQAEAAAAQWPGLIVTRCDPGQTLPKTGDEATLSSGGNGAYESANLLAISGEGKGDALIFCAHYDSSPFSPGACDNGAGVAVLLELARLTKELAPAREVRFLFLSGEEEGLFGASVYVKSLSAEEKSAIGAVYNLDMFADAAQDTPLLYTVDGETNDATARLYSALFARGLTMPVFGREDRSDHTVFAAAGIPAAMFAQSESDELYHTANDTMDKLSVSYMDLVALWCMALVS